VSAEIAIVGLGCRYPDASSPRELWHNALAGRRAFRRIPAERLRTEDYAPASESDPDSTYVRRAALVENFDLDRERFRISGPTFRSTDLAHWLALDVADQALHDSGLAGGAGLPRETTGVVIGNSLTGEGSRAALLRLRWPYVRRVFGPALLEAGLDLSATAALMERVEARFKQPFQPFGEDTLAGGLSNTIAGRICNAYDLGGGGFTIDGACSSALLAVAQACGALVAGDLDVALAGGVDVSLDPFELVGFARLGALAHGEMRVYDRDPTGFLPGEGAGMFVLMRRADAEARRLRIHAVIRGWGIASDGKGGITRPRPEGHRAAIARCYTRAGFGVDTVPLFEGHGTGTAVGDAAELAAIAGALRAAGAREPAAIGSIKAQIGHTKAAAGAAGLLKAIAAVSDQIVPPALGIEEPHAELVGVGAVLRAPVELEPWPVDRALRAGVSAIGFGGINVHVAIEAAAGSRRRGLSAAIRRLARSRQDAELLVLVAGDRAGLAARATAIAPRIGGASRAELGDLAAVLASEASVASGLVRAAIVAATPEEARAGLEELARAAEAGTDRTVDADRGWFLAEAATPPRIGLLFTGQSAPIPEERGALGRRFASAAAVWELVPPWDGDRVDTRNAQPAIVAASLAAAGVLEDLGLVAEVAIGHSLGELSALAWAGSWPAAQAIELAGARGRAMAAASREPGAMLGIAATAEEVRRLVAGTGAVIAAHNGPAQIVASGSAAAIDEVARRAEARGAAVTRLATSHAFHSPLLASAAPVLEAMLRACPPRSPGRRVISTVTGGPYDGVDVVETLVAQVTAPVCFADALSRAGRCDLLVEVGPGRILARLAAVQTDAPVVAVEACGGSLRGLLSALGAAWVLGAPVDVRELYADRWCKPARLDVPPRLFGNPCEAAPSGMPAVIREPAAQAAVNEVLAPAAAKSPRDALAVVRRCVGEATELPPGAIADGARLLEDLHMSSITIAHVVARVARALGVAVPRPLAGWVRATVEEIASAFLDEARPEAASPGRPAAAADWVRMFAVVEEAGSPPPQPRPTGGVWRWHGDGGDERAALAQAIEGTGGGTVLVLDGESGRDLPNLVAAARSARGPVLVVDRPRIAGGFARTWHLETGLPVAVVSYDRLDAETAAAIRAEAAGLGDGFRAVHVAAGGRLRAPVLNAIDAAEPAQLPVGAFSPADIVLVTGGGKGIGAECALALAERTGCAIVTLGRTRLGDDPALTATFTRFASRGVRAVHCTADITDPAAVRRSLDALPAGWRPITALVHAAAVNEPRALNELTIEAIEQTIAPKVAGYANVLAALDPGALRAIVAFGSVIARTGLPGEAHYALANELLRQAVERTRRELPDCRCAVLEWTAWSEVGMAERIGRLDALIQHGLSPISIERGVDLFLTTFGSSESVVIAGRLGDAGLVAFRRRELPLSRFLERPLVHIPGVELVTEAELSPRVDLYADDHVLDGARVMPAVMQLEAACQVAGALAADVAYRVAEVRFPRAIVIDDDRTTIRIAACRHDGGAVEVVITSSDDGHTSERMRARLEPSRRARPLGNAAVPPAASDLPPPYGVLLPQRGRFRRIRTYRAVSTRRCCFEVRTAGPGLPWFAHHVSSELRLADPGVRDAMLHGIQIAVPHERLVPVAAFGVELAPRWPDGDVIVHARELSADGGEYVWTLAITDTHGVELERWAEVRFRALGPRREIPASAVPPWIERRIGELSPSVRVVIAGTHDAELLGGGERAHRPNGKPEAADARSMSASEAGGLRFVVSGPDRVACDLAIVAPQPEAAWRDQLGPSVELAVRVAAMLGEPLDRTATRVWCALECCAKLGAPGASLLVKSAAQDALCLDAGGVEISTIAISVDGMGWLVAAIATAPRAEPPVAIESAS
jgi:enediyne polyketide synthase